MPTTVEGLTLYRIGEALEKAGVSRATYFRWVRSGRIGDVRYRDRNGRRVFTPKEVADLSEVAHQLKDLAPGAAAQLPLELAS